MQSITSVRSTCVMCGWWGTVGEMNTDVDGDGSLGCPSCYSIIPVGASPGRLAWKLRLWAWVRNIFKSNRSLTPSIPPTLPMDAKTFERLTGYAPIDDDLERVNCNQVGTIGHEGCGWCYDHNCPRFSCKSKCLATKLFGK